MGNSSLLNALLEVDRISWLPTDVLRTVLRRVLPELDATDQDPMDVSLLSELMYRRIKRSGRWFESHGENVILEARSGSTSGG